MATYKFWKIGSGFKWKIDNGPSMGPSKVTTADVPANGSVIQLAIGGAYRDITASDSVEIEGVAATGTMEAIRDRLVVEVFGNNFLIAG